MVSRSHPYWYSAQLLEWIEARCGDESGGFVASMRHAFTCGEPLLFVIAAHAKSTKIPVPRWYFDELESVSDMDDEDDVEILDFLRPYVVDDDPYAADAA